MSFEYPLWLILSLISFFVLGWILLRKVNSWMQEGFQKIETYGSLPKRRRKIFFLCGAIFLFISIARPQWGSREQQVFDQSREVLIALDLSRSMLATDVTPSRLERSKLMIQGLLQELKGERIGLLLFAGSAYLQSPLSPDYEIMSELLPDLNPDWMPQGGSNYKQMLQVAVDAFESGQASDRFLIVLSDGESTTEGWEEIADQLKSKNVRIISLGVGTATGSVIPSRSGGYAKEESGAVVMSKLESKTLIALAEKTGGVYRDAVQWVDLKKLVDETVNQGLQGEFKEQRHEKKVERFQWFLAMAWICFLCSFLWEMPVKIRPRSMKLSLLMLFFGIGAISFSFSASESISPLAEEVARLSAQKNVRPQEWADLAQKTIQRGTQNPQFPEGIVHDALAGVSQGEKADSKAADWKFLRAELQKLLEKKKSENSQNKNSEKNSNQDKQQKQNQNQDSQDSQNKNQDQNQQKNADSQNQNSSSGSPGKEGENQNKQNKSDSSNVDPQQNPGADSSQSSSEKMDSQSSPQEKSGSESKEEKSPGKQGTQKVGGNPREVSQKSSESMTKAQMMKLNQLKQDDSPATLFQVIEGKEKSQEPQKGKDW